MVPQIRMFTTLAVLLCMLASGFIVDNPATQDSSGFLYTEGGWLMLNGEVFIMKGFNYYPRDYGWTNMADWNWDAVEEELALAKSLHANTIRTGIGPLPAADNIFQKKNIYTHTQVTGEYIDAIERFLEIADRSGMMVVFWLNDLQPWEMHEPGKFKPVEEFLEQIIPLFADDPRIAAWDLGTDLDGTYLLPDQPNKWDLYPWMTRDNMVEYLRDVAETVREVDRNHLLATGFCWPSSSLLTTNFTDFLFFQFLGADYPGVLESNTQIGSADEYGFTASPAGFEEKLEEIRAQLSSEMPIVPSEFGTYSGGDHSPDFQAGIYRQALEAIFLREHLAGALNWALTDFTWPPKAPTPVEADAPQAGVEEQTFGVFDLDYNPKPAAQIASAYFDDQSGVALFTLPEQISFTFSKTFIPGEGDTRPLAIAFDYLAFMDEQGKELARLDIGDPGARPYLTSGFYDDEGPWGNEADNFAWSGGKEKKAVITYPFPAGTSAILMRILGGQHNIEMKTYVEGQLTDTRTPSGGWKKYRIEIPQTDDAHAGGEFLLMGKLNLPFSEGMLRLQTSRDAGSWQDIRTVMPEKGRFSALIPTHEAGRIYLRAVWSGTSQYEGSTSQAISVMVR
ncbi:MAG: hypothetical protein JXN59_05760 [Anaerolineae bacterium]|nr:hypothetical protein [Anaerolineae bacterium]